MIHDDGSASEKATRTLLNIMGGEDYSRVSIGFRGPYGVRLHDRSLIIVVGDQNHPLDHDALKPLARSEGCDVLATYVDDFRSGHAFTFDIVLGHGCDPVLHARRRLCLIDGSPILFVPEYGDGPALKMEDGKLTPVGDRSGLSEARLLAGVAKGQAELQRQIHVGSASNLELAKQRRPDAHPAKLAIVLPMYGTTEYRHRLVSIDDSLVVHRRGDGRFQFELRPMHKLTPRSCTGWLIRLAADLEAGYVLVIVDRDRFLSDLEQLVREHVSKRRINEVERAVAIIAERSHYQIQDHLDGQDDAACTRRIMIAARPRITKAKPFEQDGLNCIAGIPTPRAERMWNTIKTEWCDVRTSQHGRVAWEEWARANRPDMPKSEG